MGIQALCDHHGVVYRPVETRDELQDTVLVYTALAAPTGLNCRPNQNWSGALQDHGPGEQQGAMRQWFLVAEFDVAERDVLLLTEGPEAGLQVRVESVTKPTNPFGIHHLEVNGTVAHEDLVPTDEGYS